MKLHVLNALEKYAGKSHIRLHMPGHKGKPIDKFSHFSRVDITELDGSEIIEATLRAEEDVAKIYGARFCKFLVGGATGGILSMVHAVKGLGDKMIINRNAHKSVYNALELLGIEPIILSGKIVDGVVYPPSVEQTETALKENSSAIGVLYTYPDYFGGKCDISRIRALTKKYDKLLLIDNAHGAHIKFTQEKEYAGNFADVWVDSAHKTLPTFNQGAMLFCDNAKLVDSVSASAEIFATTSPCYPIIASIEYGVKYMDEEWKKQSYAFTSQRNDLKTLIEMLGVKVLDLGDVMKFSLDISSVKKDARDFERLLNQHGVFPELNDGRYILFMFSAFTDRKDFKGIYSAVKVALEKAKPCEYGDSEIITKSDRVQGYVSARKAQVEQVKLKNAVNRTCAENIGIFPPCYPLITAGEKVSAEVLEILTKAKYTFGIKDGKIKVVKE